MFITWNQDLKDHRSVWYVSVCSAADISFLLYYLISEKPSQLSESKGSSSSPSQDVRVANAETPQCFLGQIHALEEAGGKKKKKNHQQKLDAQGLKGFAKPSARDPAEIRVRALRS